MVRYKVEEFARTVQASTLEVILNQRAEDGWKLTGWFHPVDHVVVFIFEREDN